MAISSSRRKHRPGSPTLWGQKKKSGGAATLRGPKSGKREPSSQTNTLPNGDPRCGQMILWFTGPLWRATRSASTECSAHWPGTTSHSTARSVFSLPRPLSLWGSVSGLTAHSHSTQTPEAIRRVPEPTSATHLASLLGTTASASTSPGSGRLTLCAS